MLVQRERRLGSAPRARSWRAKLAAVSASPEGQRRDAGKSVLRGGVVTDSVSVLETVFAESYRIMFSGQSQKIN